MSTNPFGLSHSSSGMPIKSFQTLLKLENLRNRGEAPAGTPQLTLDQVFSRAEVMGETLQCNADLLDFFIRNANGLFMKVVESSPWVQKGNQKGNQKGSTNNSTTQNFSVPLIGPSEKIRFNYIATDIICALLKYSPGEEAIVVKKDELMLGTPSDRFNAALYGLFEGLIPQMTNFILNEEAKLDTVDSHCLYYYCRIMVSLMSKYPVRVPRILSHIDRIPQKIIHYLAFDCIQELLVKYWGLLQYSPDSAPSAVSLYETSPSPSPHDVMPPLPSFSTNLWTKLLLSNLEDNDLYASMLLAQLETAPKATLLRGILLADYFWPAIDSPKTNTKLTMLSLGIAFLSLYHQTTDLEYKEKIHEFLSSISAKRLAILCMLLQDIPLMAFLPAPIGNFQRCGPLRLKAVEFIAELAGMCAFVKELLISIRDSNTIKTLLELFKLFPWNNFLHAALTDTILFLLDTDFLTFMLEDLHLLRELLQLDQPVCVGYKGHLMILFDKLSALGVEGTGSIADPWAKKKIQVDEFRLRRQGILGGGVRPPIYEEEAVGDEGEEEIKEVQRDNVDDDYASGSSDEEDNQTLLSRASQLSLSNADQVLRLPNDEVVLFPSRKIMVEDWPPYSDSSDGEQQDEDEDFDAEYSEIPLVLQPKSTEKFPLAPQADSSMSLDMRALNATQVFPVDSTSLNRNMDDVLVPKPASPIPGVILLPDVNEVMQQEPSSVNNVYSNFVKSGESATLKNSSTSSLDTIPAPISLADPFIDIYGNASVSLNLALEQLARFVTFSMIDKHRLGEMKEAEPEDSPIKSESVGEYQASDNFKELADSTSSPRVSVSSLPSFSGAPQPFKYKPLRRRQSMPVIFPIREEPRFMPATSLSPPPPQLVKDVPTEPISHRRTNSVDIYLKQ